MNRMHFIAGAISGAVVAALLHLAFFRFPPPPPFPPDPADMEKMLIDRFSDELSLDPRQKEAIIPILMKLHRRMLDLKLSHSQEERRILDETDNELGPLLSERQRIVLGQRREQMDKFHEHGRAFLGHGPGKPGPAR